MKYLLSLLELLNQAEITGFITVGSALLVIIALWLILKRVQKNRNITIRNASLTVEELEDHARKMALEHSVSSRMSRQNWPLARMNDNYSYILAIYKDLNNEVNQKRTVPPAAEWLLDNFYVIEEQVKGIRKNLSKKEYSRLPVLKTGPYKGYTRVFAIAMELVAHIDGQIEESTLLKYLEAYQTHNILFDREIWVIPTMIRLALLENIRMICEKIQETQKQWTIADGIVERWWSDETADPEQIIKLFKSNLEAIDEANPSFVEHLFYRLRRSGRSYSNVIRYIDENLDTFGTTADAIAQKEHNAQAVSTVSMGNAIVSLKYVSNLNWVNLFESASFVERILRQDPNGTYNQMDISSRNYYRSQIEILAKDYGVSELHIAREAIALAQGCAAEKPEERERNNRWKRESHVGYYLVDKGVKRLEGRQKGRKKPHRMLVELLERHQGLIYMGAIGVMTLLITFFALHYAWQAWRGSFLLMGLLVVTAVIIPASEMAIALVNRMVCRVKKPAVFQRLELKEGIPDELSSMVVIPALLTDAKRVEELLENMENHYLANNEENLCFALIGAFRDSLGPDAHNSNQVLQKAFSGIKALNSKYAKADQELFYFYHRLSQFNENDNNWTGWERKRGALMEFNEMLLGSQDTSFTFYSHTSLPSPRIKYIITLDADTVLPLGMAKRMIGTMAHPLNIPVVDEEKGIVVEGHGLMQPKVSFDMDSSNRSIFARIYTGQEGIDPYASAISDVYQDLFGEGIFTGKGIYDLRVFHHILKDAVPENAILSHDLLEGSYVRAALVTDLELVDSYPSKYNSYMARLHRWIRGDWQLIPWLGSTIQNKHRRQIPNPLSYVSIWKMVDNLRRSLVAPAVMVLILLGFSILPGNSGFWVGFGFMALGLPFTMGLWGHFFSEGLKPDRIKRHIPGFFGLKASFFQLVLTLVFLPYQGAVILGAVTVTLVRVLITKKNMLEWVTSADADKAQSNTLGSYLAAMGGSSLIGAVVVGLAFLCKPQGLALGWILLAVWGMAPFLAFYISRDDQKEEERLTAPELLELRRIARKTWRYFEEFANRKNNYLAPDNFQEDPPRGIAFRTSPTNIGLGLLASLSGRDLGYTGIIETVESISKTITSIERMEKWNGHLYNWYDTRTLKPLNPRYVSTVDSGNFVAYLITLAQGLKDYYSRPLVDAGFIAGIKDTLRNGLDAGETVSVDMFVFDTLEQTDSISLQAWDQALTGLVDATVVANIRKEGWKAKAEEMGRQFKVELETFTPWIPMIQTIPEGFFTEALADKAGRLLSLMNTPMSLNGASEHCKTLVAHVDILMDEAHQLPGDSDEVVWLEALRAAAMEAFGYITEFLGQLDRLVERINTLSQRTRFGSLYDDRRQLFSIGFSMDDNRLTNSYYDLLASEARQTSYIAIARGEVPAKHWFMLGRSLTVVDRFKGLVSWSGTMFEYLMPLLLMRSYRNTLLDETYSFVIRSQKKYGKQRGMPWGTSESAYNALDMNLDYQYKAIGVPWLGLKRGLIEDAVAAPYATFMAFMVNPLAAYRNMEVLRSEGLEGPFGYYEAADYTPERLGAESRRVIIKSYMAHHQGMSLLALNNYLNRNTMQRRFSADPCMKAARLLLQEKVPLDVVFTKENKEKIMPFKGTAFKDSGSHRRFTEPDPVLAKAHILSNGSYSVMLTDSGTGYSRSNTLAVSRWREDPILDSYGMFFYVKDVDSNRSWSAAYAPLGEVPESYEVVFTPDKAVYKRIDGDVETTQEIAVASGDQAEIRRLSLKNTGEVPATLEVTSYFELVLAPDASDRAHPAFGNLFVNTEFSPEYSALIANRRARSEGDNGVWVAQLPIILGETVGELQYETDRMQFVGRGHTVSNPQCIEREKPLSNTTGSVLDPIFSLRVRVKVDPGKVARIAFVTMMAESREALLEMIEKYSSPETADAAFWLALTRSQVENKYLNIKATEMTLYQDMMSHILFISPLRRRNEQEIQNNRKGQESLWSYGISGDRPIILVMISKTAEVEILHELLKAHEYWRLKDLRVDLVILSQEENSYTNPLHALVREIVYTSQTHDVLNRSGDVTILNANNMTEQEISLFSATARMVFKGSRGTMEAQSEQIDNERSTQ